MKTKILILFLSLMLLVGCSSGTQKDYNDPYDSKAAVDYAKKYYEKRNSDYGNLEYNCTNFVSQCLVAGGKEMDSPDKSAEPNKRIVYSGKKSKWYCQSKVFDENKPPSYSVSSSFVRTDDFLEYWTEVRGIEYEYVKNNFAGRESLPGKVKLGDIICLYNADNEVEHFGIVTKIDDALIYYSSNTNNRLDHLLVGLSDSVYIKIGILHME